MLPFHQIVSSEQFIVRQKPQEEMNFRGNFHFPHGLNINREHTSKIYNCIKRTNTIYPFRLILPDNSILLSTKVDGLGYLEDFIPLNHQSMIKASSESDPKLVTIPDFCYSRRFFINNGIQLPVLNS